MQNKTLRTSIWKEMRHQYLKYKATPTAKQGGVAVITKDSTCQGMIAAGAKTNEARSLREQGRHKRMAIPIGKMNVQYT